MAEQAEQKKDYKNAMMYYKEILAIAPKSSRTAEAVKNIKENIESMFSFKNIDKYGSLRK